MDFSRAVLQSIVFSVESFSLDILFLDDLVFCLNSFPLTTNFAFSSIALMFISKTLVLSLPLILSFVFFLVGDFLLLGEILFDGECIRVGEELY
jgi:hypothetical protein